MLVLGLAPLVAARVLPRTAPAYQIGFLGISYQTHQLWGDGLVWRAAGILLTVQAVCFGFLIFSGHLNFSTR